MTGSEQDSTSATGVGHGEEQSGARQPESTGVNARRWRRGGLVGFYANRNLRPVEVMLLVRYRESLGDRILELGCGAGRLTGYLAALGGEVHALDISADMVAYCQRAYPQAIVRHGDLSDLSAYAMGSFSAVLAPFNVLDVLDDAQRQRTLDDIARRLRPEGVLIMSTHNLEFAPTSGVRRILRRGDKPLWRSLASAMLDAPRLPLRSYNRRRLRGLQRREPGYSIVNDEGHDYSLLHYHISRAHQEQQLSRHGFDFIECLDLDGRPVVGDDRAGDHSELHYVARLRSVKDDARSR